MPASHNSITSAILLSTASLQQTGAANGPCWGSSNTQVCWWTLGSLLVLPEGVTPAAAALLNPHITFTILINSPHVSNPASTPLTTSNTHPTPVSIFFLMSSWRLSRPSGGINTSTPMDVASSTAAMAVCSSWLRPSKA